MRTFTPEYMTAFDVLKACNAALYDLERHHEEQESRTIWLGDDSCTCETCQEIIPALRAAVAKLMVGSEAAA